MRHYTHVHCLSILFRKLANSGMKPSTAIFYFHWPQTTPVIRKIVLIVTSYNRSYSTLDIETTSRVLECTKLSKFHAFRLYK